MDAEVVDGDLSPVATAKQIRRPTMTPEGRLRVDAALSVADVELNIATYTEDAAAPANPTGIATMLVRRDTPVTNEVSAENDIIAWKGTNKGEGRTNDADANAALLPTMLTGRLLSAAATTNATNVKASAGRVYGIQGYNAVAAVTYLKLYNIATAPTVGTTVPVKTLALPPSSAFAFDWPRGYAFATGIGFGLTAAAGGADNSTTAVAAGDVLGLNIDYV